MSENLSKEELSTPNENFIGDESVSQWNLNTFCVSGKICKNRLCIADLLDSDMRTINPGNCFAILVLCKPCYNSLYGEYKALKEKIMPIRTGSFFREFISVKINAELNKIKQDCCSKEDCKISSLSEEEYNIVKQKFNQMYEAFAYAD